MTDPHKYKGTDRNNTRPGMGRLRRAHATDAGRLSGWENRVEDDAYIEKHAQTQKRSHAGEALLAKFNRLASQTRARVGEPAEICGFVGKEVVVRFPARRSERAVLFQVVLASSICRRSPSPGGGFWCCYSVHIWYIKGTLFAKQRHNKYHFRCSESACCGRDAGVEGEQYEEEEEGTRRRRRIVVQWCSHVI